MLKSPTTQEQVAEICKEVQEAMLENILANQALTQAELRKKKSHYQLVKANERMRAIQMELSTGLNI